ncbi:MAG TPA: peptidase M28 family protein, partial [Stenotrophomonas sp.]
MRRRALSLALLLLCTSAAANAAPTHIPQQSLAKAGELREQALADNTAWQVVESLTTEIGPRMAGSEADARAVEWAKA